MSTKVKITSVEAVIMYDDLISTILKINKYGTIDSIIRKGGNDYHLTVKYHLR